MAPRAELRAPARRVARLVALEHLDDAARARTRLDDPHDAEALHAFRVALRRLRSWERAFRPFLADGIGRTLRRRLRDVARATGASRDAEVHLAWLADLQETARGRERAGLHWLRAKLELEREGSDRDLRDAVEGEFASLRDKLERRLERYRERVWVRGGDAPQRFADALAPRVREMTRELAAHLALVSTIADESEAHQARIAGKRLRYLLEPIADEWPDAADIVARLKALQDVIGDLHDAQLFARTVADAAREATAEYAASVVDPRIADVARADVPAESRPAAPRVRRRDPSPGLAMLAERLEDRSTHAFATLAAEWLGDASAGFFATCERLADEISAAGRETEAPTQAPPRDTEIERKYLLRELPKEAHGGHAMVIEQGYLPGERLHERVRRVTTRDGRARHERYYRTIKLGAGLTRTEIEEEIPRALFDGLWRLTKGHRLRKRRWAVADGAHTWEIDEFLDRDLVLAEVELQDASESIEPPAWLAAALEREVTDDPAYLNLNLAR